MVSLVETYREAGFEPVTSELPDHLPVLLEFLATQPPKAARDILADAAHIFEALQVRLLRRESPYAAVFACLMQLAGATADREAVAQMLSRTDDDPAERVAAFDALSAAVTALIAAIGVSIAGGESSKAVSDDIQARFHGNYQTHAVGSADAHDQEVVNAVYSQDYAPEVATWRDGTAAKGASGWDFDDRWVRAKAIASNYRT